MIPPGESAVLVIGHPGHELRVFHWLEMVRPVVFVLTDGSGASGYSRLPSTTRVLDRVGATRGSFYGILTDSEVYNAILNRDFEVFIKLAREVARFLMDEKVSYVAGDSAEGYNPTHDVCRLVICAAVNLANRSRVNEVKDFDFQLTGAANGSSPNHDLRIELDDDAFARKLDIARSYSGLEAEVNDALNTNSELAFRVECLRPVRNYWDIFSRDAKPFYEEYGEKRVAEGKYNQVIRYREHVLPLAEALRQMAARD